MVDKFKYQEYEAGNILVRTRMFQTVVKCAHIDVGSKILLSLGEADCRTGGIVRHSKCQTVFTGRHSVQMGAEPEPALNMMNQLSATMTTMGIP